MADDLQTDVPADAGEEVGDRARVTRSVDIAAGADAVWDAVADPDRRATWLDDADAAGRAFRVDEVDTGRRLVWTWWHDRGDGNGDDGGASTVEVALRPLDGGGTRVVITETLAVPLPVALTSPSPSAPVPPRATANAHATATARATASAGVRARAGRAWDRRLLGLELVFVGVLAGAR